MEVLARATRMRVVEVVDGLSLLADHVYVMPAHADSVIADGALRLTSRLEPVGVHLPIDRFFGSMAEEYGSRSAAVVLSGAGSDGALGVRLVKAGGGVTFAQAAHEAASTGMPAAAVATGCVEFVLPVGEIAAEIVRLSKGAHFGLGAASAAFEAPAELESLQVILAALRKTSGIDFSLYRQTTVRRRIARRLALRRVADIGSYATLLEEEPDELVQLQADLLIGVTRFFRDPEVFEALVEHVLPKLLRDRPPSDPVRVWIPGCATGEEAVTLAICLLEHMQKSGAGFPVQIFASDINESAAADARRGFYSTNIVADVDPERLAKYFERVAGGYLVRDSIRELCVFTRHNLLEDPPFSRLDLISCRNVLMYLVGAQRSILRLFHYALKPGGRLVLGPAESAPLDDMFTAVDPPNRIYAKRATTRRLPMLSMPSRASRAAGSPSSRASVAGRAQPWDSEDHRKRVDRALLVRFSPPVVIVSESFEVLEMRGEVGPYLALPDGNVSFNLVKLVRDTGLYLQIEGVVRETLERDEGVRREGLEYISGGELRFVTLDAVPMQMRDSRVVMVVFEPAEARGSRAEGELDDPEVDGGGVLQRQVARLGQELDQSRQRLNSLVEDYQDSREELQNVTEKALSANEELRSLNEELETAKEEVQCANEELSSLNTELQATNEALVASRDQALWILAAVQHPLVVLDRSLSVVNANDAFEALFHVRVAEIRGRELSSVSSGIFAVPELRRQLSSLSESFTPPSLELVCETPATGRLSLLVTARRIRRLDLLLLSIEDLTERRAIALALSRAEDKLRRAEKVESMGRLAGGIAHDFNNLLTAIRGYSEMLGATLKEDPGALEMLRIIDGASGRAATLTRQLLALGRLQVLQPKVIDLNTVVSEFESLLRRVVGESIECVIECEPGLWRVRADPDELARVLLNLALNARDAMPNGGTLTIRTANLSVTSGQPDYEELAPGRYATLTLSDTGPGMDESVRAQIFEPFFTTKGEAHGTGLGLASVLGIVEQSGGVIRCRSKLEVGTSFHVLLPAVSAELEVETSLQLVSWPGPNGVETVLVAEDDQGVREMARRALAGRGYTVLVASDGQEGLEIGRRHGSEIHLLVTDIVMPGLGGREFAIEFQKLRPGARVMYMSGYAPDARLRTELESGGAFLQKPFTPFELTTMVRGTLDAVLGVGRT